MILILQEDNAADNERRRVDTALTELRRDHENLKQSIKVSRQTMEQTTLREIRTNQEDLKESIQIGMQMMMNAIEQLKTQDIQRDNKIESLQSKAMKYGQLDEYIERKRIDKEKMAEYLLQREKGWKY